MSFILKIIVINKYTIQMVIKLATMITIFVSLFGYLNTLMV